MFCSYNFLVIVLKRNRVFDLYTSIKAITPKYAPTSTTYNYSYQIRPESDFLYCTKYNVYSSVDGLSHTGYKNW